MAERLERIADGVFRAEEPVRIVGMKLHTTMTVLQLPDGTLMVHSPIPLTPARREAVEALGEVAHVYAPSTFHHLWAGQWAAAFPAARVHAPAALAGKRPELRIDRAHDRERDPALAGIVDEVHVDGFRLEESVVVHRPSRTLVVADLVHNVGRPTDLWTVLYTRASGFYDRVALSRVIRWTAFSDRRAARRSLDAILDLDFARVIVGHGAPFDADAPARLAEAYAWLPPDARAPAALSDGTRPLALRGSACG